MMLLGDNGVVTLHNDFSVRRNERERERKKTMRTRGKRISKKFKNHLSKGGGIFIPNIKMYHKSTVILMACY